MTIPFIVALILAGLILILFEFFTPTFGPLAALGVMALAGAVWLAFTISTATGVTLIVCMAIGVPIYVALLMKNLHRLPGAKNMFLEKVTDMTATGTPDAAALEAFVGKTGTAETLLRPSGDGQGRWQASIGGGRERDHRERHAHQGDRLARNGRGGAADRGCGQAIGQQPIGEAGRTVKL